MVGWLIYNEYEKNRNIEYINKYFYWGKILDIKIELVIYEDIKIAVQNKSFDLYYKNQKVVDLPDFIICRYPDQILVKQLEYMRIPVFNNYKVSDLTNDKFKTYQYITSLGIETLKTIYCSDINLLPPFFPCVIKPVDGKGGKDVYLLNNINDYENVKKFYDKKKFIYQEVAKNKGKDLRVYVIGKKIIAAMLRSSDVDFKSNYCLGGKASVYCLSEEEKKIINKIISNFDFGLVGIDFVFNDKIIFNEIEDVVGARMLYAHTDIDIVKEYLQFIKKKILRDKRIKMPNYEK